MTGDNGLNKQWPSVDVAYGFVLPSYQLLAGRFEAADHRLTSLLSIASGLTLAAPILARAVTPEITFTSRLFIAGLLLFAVIVVLGLVGRIIGVLTLPDPMVHYKMSLHEPEWVFKKNAIYFAGLHFESNANAINRKSNVAILITLLLVAQVFCFALWIAG